MIDQFGNIVTSFREELLPPSSTNFLLLTGRQEVTSRAEAYDEAEPGTVFCDRWQFGLHRGIGPQGSRRQSWQV